MRLRMIPRLVAVGAMVAGLVAVPAPVAQAAGLEEVTGFGTNPGNLKMFRYVPAGLSAGRPLVVALHGCTQSAAAYDAEPGWVEVAERMGFALVLPQQQSANNFNSCFNWFEPGDTTRGSGEALSIKQMVDRMRSDYASDAGRIYVTGLSAGGAMTAVILATYPEVFAAGRRCGPALPMRQHFGAGTLLHVPRHEPHPDAMG
jgi:poly(3-hydroxybutyrate) depolymerase